MIRSALIRLMRRRRAVRLTVGPDGFAVRFAVIICGVEASASVAPDDARLFATGLLTAADEADRTAAEALA